MKKVYATPRLVVHGTIEDLTQQTKNKTWGGSDDVLINSMQMLSTLS